MARFEFKLPDIGEGVAEGEIVSWLVKEGDTVGQDQDMVEVMTDKATVTIGAPRPGTVVELRAKAGDVVPVGDVLVVFDSEGGEAGAGAKPEEGAKPEPAKAPEQASQATETGRARQVAQQEGEGEGPAATAVGDLRESLPGMSPAAPAGALAWKIRSSMPSRGWPWVIGIRCGWLQLDPVTRPRTRTTSSPPLRSERRTSTLVTNTTGAGGPPTVPDGWPGPGPPA